MDSIYSYIKFITSLLFFSTFICVSLFEKAYSQEFFTDSLKIKDDSYNYKHEGRADPFKPFIAPKSTSPVMHDPNEIVEEKVEYTGMQLFEPGQLTLVGVLLSSKDPIAMVEDQTKKGYTLKLGNLIGKRGVVTSIEQQQVIVTETAKTRAGREIKNIVTMRIKKEGDK